VDAVGAVDAGNARHIFALPGLSQGCALAPRVVQKYNGHLDREDATVSALLPNLIDWLQQYGYPVLWLFVFIAAVGVPLPTSLVLLASGAFAALGEFNILVLGIIAVTASTSGDNVGYFIGRRWGSKVLLWLEHSRWQHFISPRNFARAQAYFQRRGGWAIFLTRFLFSALGGVTNLLTGADLYPYHRFLLLDLAGEAIGAAIALLLGYLFGASWEAVGDILGAISVLALALLAVIFLISYIIKLVRQTRVVGEEQGRSNVDTPVAKVDVVSRKNPGRNLLP
jgi:membrane-associated protein